MCDNRKLLSNVVADVMERFAFSFVEAEEDGDGNHATDCLWAEVSFEGPSKGAVGLVVPWSLALELAASILGMDPAELGESAGEDAVRELTNIMCGEMLPLLFGTEPVFDLSVPHMRRVKGSEVDIDPPVESVGLMVEDEPVTATLRIEP